MRTVPSPDTSEWVVTLTEAVSVGTASSILYNPASSRRPIRLLKRRWYDQFSRLCFLRGPAARVAIRLGASLARYTFSARLPERSGPSSRTLLCCAWACMEASEPVCSNMSRICSSVSQHPHEAFWCGIAEMISSRRFSLVKADTACVILPVTIIPHIIPPIS